jgi:hypothetical protein
MEIRKSILIVCEGESSEPNYFHELVQTIVNDRKLADVKIKITPIPKREAESQEENDQALTETIRPRRQIKVDNKNLEEIYQEEEKYRSQPVCYVRRAQIGLRDYGYDEAWSVYDKDGHAHQERAFEQSKEIVNDKKVNIAFSSIAFEQWILLHFEDAIFSFEKSMCRIQDSNGKRIYLYCGSKKHAEDCKGEHCICGRLVSSKYLEYKTKGKDFSFEDYHKNVQVAITNSITLGKLYNGSDIPFYNRNPFTNLHRLVFKLLRLPMDYLWFEFTEAQKTSMQSSFELSIENSTIHFLFNNESDITQIFNPDSLVLVNILGESKNVGERKLIEPGQGFQINITLADYMEFNPLFISFKLEEGKALITEIPN